MPIGAIVFAEHWVFPRLGIEQYQAERKGWAFNWAALAVWLGTLAVAFVLPLHLYFRWLPGWFIALATYTALMAARRLFFLGRITEGSFKTAFLVASVAWFVFAVARGSSGENPAAG